MCFQNLIRYVCGHEILVEEECERAAAAGIPLFIKVNCIDYQSENNVSGIRCGLGGYYCKQTPDGQMLEALHCRIDDSIHVIARLEGELEKARVALKEFKTRADTAGLTQEVWEKHPIYLRIVASGTYLQQEHGRCIKTRQQLLFNSQQVFHFYKRRTQDLIATGQQVTAPYDDFIQHSNRQRTAVWQAHQLARQRSAQSTQLGLQQGQFPNDNLNNSLLQHGNLTKIGGCANPMQTSEIASTKAARPRKTRKRKQDTPDVDDSGLRRSTRKKNKDVRYAESEASTESREPSPNKSELSSFSPAKSDVSASSGLKDGLKNQKRQLTARASNVSQPPRIAGNLGTMINDWHRMTNQAPAAQYIAPAPQAPLLNLTTTNAVPTIGSMPYGNTNAPASAIDQKSAPPSNTPQYRLPPDYIKNIIAKRAAFEAQQARQGVSIPQTPQEAYQHSPARPPTRHGPPDTAAYGQSSAYSLQHAAMPNFLPPVPIVPSQQETAGRYIAPDVPMHYDPIRNRQMGTAVDNRFSFTTPGAQQTGAIDSSNTSANIDNRWLLDTSTSPTSAGVVLGADGIQYLEDRAAPPCDSVMAASPNSRNASIDRGRNMVDGINAQAYNSTNSANGLLGVPSSNWAIEQNPVGLSSNVLDPGVARGPPPSLASLSNVSATTTAEYAAALLNNLRSHTSAISTATAASTSHMPAPPDTANGMQSYGSNTTTNTLAPTTGVSRMPRDYEHMRRSFSATAELTPPSVPGRAPFDSDPRKRAMPPSSPEDTPVKKRARLSLPGDEDDKTHTPAPILTPDPRLRRKSTQVRSSDTDQTLAAPARVSELPGHDGVREKDLGEAELPVAEAGGEVFDSEIDWIEREENDV